MATAQKLFDLTYCEFRVDWYGMQPSLKLKHIGSQNQNILGIIINDLGFRAMTPS